MTRSQYMAVDLLQNLENEWRESSRAAFPNLTLSATRFKVAWLFKEVSEALREKMGDEDLPF